MAAVVVMAMGLAMAAAQAPCEGKECFAVEANKLTFDCRSSGKPSATHKALLLHGFPEWSSHWVPLLNKWDKDSADIYAVACDLRGYSSGASPRDPSLYLYMTLASDVYALASALHLGGFHLVGHDHGAGVGWLAASEAAAGVAALYPSVKLFSYTVMSFPHLDPFSTALVGPDADEMQQVAVVYFNQMKLVNSATINNNALANLIGPHYAGFPSAEAAQTAFWWYRGAAGHVALPPIYNMTEMKKYLDDNAWQLMIEKAVPLPEGPGIAQTSPIGKVSVPVTFICASKDVYLLCTRPYAEKTRDYVTGKFRNLTVDCGHNMLQSEDCWQCCESQEAVDQVMTAITHQITGSL